MGIVDLVAAFLQESLQAAEDGVIEVQRSELARQFHCVPSQISYIVRTRFSPECGYVVESRRGGHGCIRIMQVRMNRETLVMHAVNSIGDCIDSGSARAILNNLIQAEAISVQTGQLLLAVTGEQALSHAPQTLRDQVRADIMKQALLHCV